MFQKLQILVLLVFLVKVSQQKVCRFFQNVQNFLEMFVNFQQKVFFFYNYATEANEKFVNETSLKHKCELNTRQSPCSFMPVTKVSLLVDLERPYVHIQGRDLSLDRVVMDQTVNVCLLNKQPGLDLFVKLIYEMLRKNINFDLKCPFRKGRYESKHFVNSYPLLLNFFQLNKPQRYSATIKSRSGKAIQDIFVFQVDFEVVEVDG